MENLESRIANLWNLSAKGQDKYWTPLRERDASTTRSKLQEKATENQGHF